MRFKFWHVKTNGFWLIQSMGAWSVFPSIPGVEQVVHGPCADNRWTAAKNQAQCQFSLFNSRAALSQGSCGWLPPLWCCSCVAAPAVPDLWFQAEPDFVLWIDLGPLRSAQAVVGPGRCLRTGLCSFSTLSCSAFCSVTQSREGLHKFIEESPLHSTAAAYQEMFVGYNCQRQQHFESNKCSWFCLSFNSCSRKWVIATSDLTRSWVFKSLYNNSNKTLFGKEEEEDWVLSVTLYTHLVSWKIFISLRVIDRILCMLFYENIRYCFH